LLIIVAWIQNAAILANLFKNVLQNSSSWIFKEFAPNSPNSFEPKD